MSSRVFGVIAFSTYKQVKRVARSSVDQGRANVDKEVFVFR